MDQRRWRSSRPPARSRTGVGGLTLGGGFAAWRRFGLARQRKSVDLVTAGGESGASPTENPSSTGACGGGGNFAS
jgi:hypothetical protein